MGRESLTQIQEAQRVPYKINPRRNTPKHILIKLTKIKDKKKNYKTFMKEFENVVKKWSYVLGLEKLIL